MLQNKQDAFLIYSTLECRTSKTSPAGNPPINILFSQNTAKMH